MNEVELKQLAITWTRLCHAKRNSEEFEEDFWSFETLSEFCGKNPEYAWRVIVEIYDNDPGEMVVANLAAGPLEDLLVFHGRLALGWISHQCSNDAGFVKVLQMVWRNAMPEEVWDGLNRLIKKHT